MSALASNFIILLSTTWPCQRLLIDLNRINTYFPFRILNPFVAFMRCSLTFFVTYESKMSDSCNHKVAKNRLQFLSPFELAAQLKRFLWTNRGESFCRFTVSTLYPRLYTLPTVCGVCLCVFCSLSRVCYFFCKLISIVIS